MLRPSRQMTSGRQTLALKLHEPMKFGSAAVDCRIASQEAIDRKLNIAKWLIWRNC
jgi:hypothetical protein